MKLLVDSGSTKADWIAIDDNGKVLFTTQTLGLNPEVLDKEEIINRLDDKFDISHNKDKATHLFFYGAGCGTDRMKDFLTLVFKDYFSNASVVVHEDTYAAVFATTPKEEKAIVSHETDIDELKAEIKTIENDISRLDEIIDEKKLNLEMLIKKSPEYDIAKKEIKELSKDKSKYFKKIKSCKTKIKSREMDISDSKDKIKQHKLQAEKQQELIYGKLKIVDLLIEKKAGIH